MKSRMGFVSNSSSASFVLTIKDRTKEEFLQDALDAMRYSTLYFDERGNIKRELEERLTQYKSIAEKGKTAEKGIKPWYDYGDSIKQLESILACLNDENVTENDKAERYLKEYCYIDIIYHEDFGDCEIRGFTSMYNDDNDIPEPMRTMTAYYALHNRPVRMEVHDDGGF